MQGVTTQGRKKTYFGTKQLSDCAQTLPVDGGYDPESRSSHKEPSLVMRRRYLHLAAFDCAACNGPVISGSIATREADIQRETGIKQIGAICLACGKRYNSLPTARAVRHIAPFEWNSVDQEGAVPKSVSVV